MKATITLLFILVFSFGVSAQSKASTEYSFPDKSEYSVKFPEKPTLSVILGGVTNFTVSAQLKTSDCLLRADSVKLTAKEAKKLAQMSDREFSAIPQRYAEASGIRDSSVKTGTDNFGRFAKLRGYKEVDGVPNTFEILFFLGKGEIMTIYTAAKSSEYQTAEIAKFTGSLTVDSSFNSENNKDKKSLSGKTGYGLAKDLTAPAYPPAARAVRASGAVSVQVEIDENGEVVKAKAVTGHPLLRSASEEAALKAKFRPFRISGEAVQVTGVLVYNFVP